MHVHAGEFAAASALIEEADAIAAATGNAPLRYASLLLAAWRGEEARTLKLIETRARGRDRQRRGKGHRFGWSTSPPCCTTVSAATRPPSPAPNGHASTKIWGSSVGPSSSWSRRAPEAALRCQPARGSGLPGAARSILDLEHAVRLLNAYECVKAFSETDFTEDLKRFDVPTLVLHGEDDQIVPVKDSAVKSARLIKGAKDIYYPGAPHGITATHQDQVNAELLAFLRGSPETSRRGDRMMAAASTNR